MDGPADNGIRPARVLKLAGGGVAALLVVAAAALAALYVWLRMYSPLESVSFGFAPGPGIGATIQPATGSGGEEVFFPAYRHGKPFDAGFTLRNTGHFTVTVTGLVPARPQAAPWVGAVAARATDAASSSEDVAHSRPFEPIALAAGDTAALVVRFDLACPTPHGRVAPVFADSVRLRYTYLRIFHRTQTVKLPFAVTLRCTDGPLASP